MIQKRSNPLDAQNAPAEQPAEAAVSAEEITPVEAATPADNVKPVEQKELQKRVNPLTLEERPQIVEAPLPAPAKAPTTIIGKTKKKRVMSKAKCSMPQCSHMHSRLIPNCLNRLKSRSKRKDVI